MYQTLNYQRGTESIKIRNTHSSPAGRMAQKFSTDELGLSEENF
jgi:hypothetical protein